MILFFQTPIKKKNILTIHNNIKGQPLQVKTSHIHRKSSLDKSIFPFEPQKWTQTTPLQVSSKCFIPAFLSQNEQVFDSGNLSSAHCESVLSLRQSDAQTGITYNRLKWKQSLYNLCCHISGSTLLSVLWSLGEALDRKDCSIFSHQKDK